MTTLLAAYSQKNTELTTTGEYMSIELRLSEVDPPAPDPPKTLYRDVLDLPDPVKLGITVRYFNNDDVGLYFRITGSGTGYTFGTVNLGLLGSGANAYRNLDDFGSRAKPSAGQFTAGEFDETIKLILKAYTDSGYTNLKWTYERTVGVHWIKSDDAAWTLDELDNFDDGTVQGWAAVNETNALVLLEVVTDYVLSAPYSIRMRMLNFGTRPCQVRSRLYKSFTTPDRAKVYAIFNIRNSLVMAGNSFIKNIQFLRDTTLLVFLGRPYDTVEAEYVPKNKWMRAVVPLPRNVTVDLRIVYVYLQVYGEDTYYQYLWLDDFKIISK